MKDIRSINVDKRVKQHLTRRYEKEQNISISQTREREGEVEREGGERGERKRKGEREREGAGLRERDLHLIKCFCTWARKKDRHIDR